MLKISGTLIDKKVERKSKSVKLTVRDFQGTKYILNSTPEINFKLIDIDREDKIHVIVDNDTDGAKNNLIIKNIVKLKSTYKELIQIIETLLKVDLSESHQKRTLIDAKKIYCLLLKEYTTMTLEEIGSYFDDHHANILHHVNSARELMETNEAFKTKYNRCQKEFLKLLINNQSHGVN